MAAIFEAAARVGRRQLTTANVRSSAKAWLQTAAAPHASINARKYDAKYMTDATGPIPPCPAALDRSHPAVLTPVCG